MQNDQRSGRNVFKRVSAKDSLKKPMEKHHFPIYFLAASAAAAVEPAAAAAFDACLGSFAGVIFIALHYFALGDLT